MVTKDYLFIEKFPCFDSILHFPVYIVLYLHFNRVVTFFALFAIPNVGLKDLIEPMNHIYLSALSYFGCYYGILTKANCSISLKNLPNLGRSYVNHVTWLTTLIYYSRSTEHAMYISIKWILVLVWQIFYTVTKYHGHTCLINCSCLLKWIPQITQFLVILTLTWTFIILWSSMLRNAITILSHISMNLLSTKYLQHFILILSCKYPRY